MARCKGKTSDNVHCHNHTNNTNIYCRIHQLQAPTGEDCPVCVEPLTGVDTLSCGHHIHKQCVQKAVDSLQDQLVEYGFPPRRYGQCPICRADQQDIVAKPSTWVGNIELTTNQMLVLLNILTDNNGFIQRNLVPEFVSDQMPNAHPDEQCLFANNAASMLWLSGYKVLPRKIRIRQYRGGRFAHYIFF